MTETVPLPEFVTYAVVLVGSIATDVGARPTGIVANTRFFAVHKTDTVLLPKFGTKTFVPSGVRFGKAGAMPTGMVAISTSL